MRRLERAIGAMVLPCLLAWCWLSACGMPEESQDAQGSGDTGRLDPREDMSDLGGGTPAGQAGWRALGQTQRNQAILSRATSDNGRYVGLNCKEWARRVVTDASQGAVVLPPTAPDAYGWYWSSDPYAERLGIGIRDVQPGCIVQMNVRYASGAIGPHTAIVQQVLPAGVVWIESNWAAPDGVRTRYQAFADFERSTLIGGTARYSVYRIGAG